MLIKARSMLCRSYRARRLQSRLSRCFVAFNLPPPEPLGGHMMCGVAVRGDSESYCCPATTALALCYTRCFSTAGARVCVCIKRGRCDLTVTLATTSFLLIASVGAAPISVDGTFGGVPREALAVVVEDRELVFVEDVCVRV